MEINREAIFGQRERKRSAQDEKGQPGRGGMQDFYAQVPDAHLLFIGSVNCLRHKPFSGLAEMMRQRRASILTPTMTDFSTGHYLRQIVDAVAELSQKRGNRFILAFGCQWVILSTDEDMIRQELREKYGIEVFFYDDSHLEFGDHA